MVKDPAPPILELRNASKRFGSVIALNNVGISVHAGKVTCVLGDNGAGKSTLIHMLAGLTEPDSGTLFVDGEKRRFRSPRDASAAGVATVYQNLAVAPLMPVWRNFFLGRELTKGWGPLKRLDIAEMRRVTKTALAEMGIDLRDVEQPIGQLSGGERQSVTIARAVHFGARVLVLDEPTAALGVKQSGLVLRHIQEATKRGVGVAFITHNPNHAHPVGDEFVVLRRGQQLAHLRRDEVSAAELGHLMAGGEEFDQALAGLEG